MNEWMYGCMDGSTSLIPSWDLASQVSSNRTRSNFALFWFFLSGVVLESTSIYNHSSSASFLFFRKKTFIFWLVSDAKQAERG